jgi:hypothetical protein
MSRPNSHRGRRRDNGSQAPAPSPVPPAAPTAPRVDDAADFDKRLRITCRQTLKTSPDSIPELCHLASQFTNEPPTAAKMQEYLRICEHKALIHGLIASILASPGGWERMESLRAPEFADAFWKAASQSSDMYQLGPRTFRLADAIFVIMVHLARKARIFARGSKSTARASAATKVECSVCTDLHTNASRCQDHPVCKGCHSQSLVQCTSAYVHECPFKPCSQATNNWGEFMGRPTKILIRRYTQQQSAIHNMVNLGVFKTIHCNCGHVISLDHTQRSIEGPLRCPSYPACQKTYHGACGELLDGASEHKCAMDQEMEAVEKRFTKVKCPGCRQGIDRNGGCNHMTCLCGAQFCFHCQAPWDTNRRRLTCNHGL